MNLTDVAILNIKGSDCRCIISLISKNEAIKLIQNADLTEKRLSNIKKLLSYVKMDKEILTFRDTEIEKKKITAIRLLFLYRTCILKKYSYLTRLALLKKAINTLLVTCIIIIKLSH